MPLTIRLAPPLNLLISSLDLLSEFKVRWFIHAILVSYLNARHFVWHSRINFDTELDIIENNINQNFKNRLG